MVAVVGNHNHNDDHDDHDEGSGDLDIRSYFNFKAFSSTFTRSLAVLGFSHCFPSSLKSQGAGSEEDEDVVLPR